MQTTLTEALTFLLSSEQRNFYARIVSSLVRIERPGMGTMGVGLSKDGKNCLYYDPEFIKKMPLQEFVLTCEHEVCHLLLGHIPRYLNLLSNALTEQEREQFRVTMNTAADCAANEVMRAAKNFNVEKGKWFYGSELTDGRLFLTPELFNLERNKPYEVYHYQLQKRIKDNDEKLKDILKSRGVTEEDVGTALQVFYTQCTGNAHQIWDLVTTEAQPDELQGLADKLLQDAKTHLQKAVDEQQKGRGTIPAHMLDLIKVFLTPPVIPWPSILRQLCMRTHQVKQTRGMTRPSRRLHGVPNLLPFPGRTKDMRFTIAFCLDTSGSMSRKELALGFTELLNIVRTEPEVTLVIMYCDASLHVQYNVTKIDDIDFTVKGRGGTDFNPPFVRIRELLRTDQAPDVLIYATDGYAPAPDVENRIPIPVIWLLTPTGVEPSPDYGIHLRMVDA